MKLKTFDIEKAETGEMLEYVLETFKHYNKLRNKKDEILTQHLSLENITDSKVKEYTKLNDDIEEYYSLINRVSVYIKKNWLHY